MPIAAVPKYLGSDFGDASPALHFGILLKIWMREGEKEDKKDKKGRKAWDKSTKTYNAIHTRVARDHARCMEELVARQNALHDALHDSGKDFIDAESTAPFTTGLGNDHPLENGFSFLNPYGLPYLPGSGVKGVVRRAAQELANGDWGDSCGWDYELMYSANNGKKYSMIDVLFGYESKSGDQDQFRGVLSFWDVVPRIKNNLAVEVMTPHQTKYYQNSDKPNPPDEFSDPVPIFFLTVPPGSKFGFHVVCHTERLQRFAPDLAANDHWKQLLNKAFRHAFDWLGFGAKTAVGYGAMQLDPEAEKREQQRRKEQERIKRQKAEEKRKKEEQERKEKAAREEEARKKDEFDALPESRRMLKIAKEHFEKFREGGQFKAQLRKDNANQQANLLIKYAPEWPNADREEAVLLLEQYYKEVPVRGKKAQREKREKKRSEDIARIRRGPE